MHWIDALPVAAAGVPVGVCGARIASRYDGDCDRPVHPAIIIAVTVAAFAAMGARFGLVPVLPAYCYLAAVAVPLSFIDARHQRLPDLLTLPFYPIAVALLAAAAVFTPGGARQFVHAVYGAIGVLALYAVLAFTSRGAIGGGDVKLSGVLGLYLGWLGMRACVVGVIGAFVLAAVIAVVLLLTGARKRTHIPFGPFMLASAIFAALTPALRG